MVFQQKINIVTFKKEDLFKDYCIPLQLVLGRCHKKNLCVCFNSD